MRRAEHIRSTAVSALDQQTFAGLGCSEHGIAILQGARSWEAHERGLIEVPTDDGAIAIPLAHDERGGPYALAADGSEQADLLVSLTDEGETLACAWARRRPASPLVGVGIDLCDTTRFMPRDSGRTWSEVLLTPQEWELVSTLTQKDAGAPRHVLGASFFAAKEAAFKATAAPLRRWYDTHGEQLRYEVRHFVMEEPGFERGTGRDGAAQRAMERMGIAQVAVYRAVVGQMALVTAVALAAPTSEGGEVQR